MGQLADALAASKRATSKAASVGADFQALVSAAREHERAALLLRSSLASAPESERTSLLATAASHERSAELLLRRVPSRFGGSALGTRVGRWEGAAGAWLNLYQLRVGFWFESSERKGGALVGLTGQAARLEILPLLQGMSPVDLFGERNPVLVATPESLAESGLSRLATALSALYPTVETHLGEYRHLYQAALASLIRASGVLDNPPVRVVSTIDAGGGRSDAL